MSARWLAQGLVAWNGLPEMGCVPPAGIRAAGLDLRPWLTEEHAFAASTFS